MPKKSVLGKGFDGIFDDAKPREAVEKPQESSADAQGSGLVSGESSIDSKSSNLEVRESSIDSGSTIEDNQQSSEDTQVSKLDGGNFTEDKKASTIEDQISSRDSGASNIESPQSTVDTRPSRVDSMHSTIEDLGSINDPGSTTVQPGGSNLEGRASSIPISTIEPQSLRVESQENTVDKQVQMIDKPIVEAQPPTVEPGSSTSAHSTPKRKSRVRAQKAQIGPEEIDAEALEMACQEVIEKEKYRITAHAPAVALVLRYLEITTPRYRLGTEAAMMLEAAVQKAYPDLWALAVEKVKPHTRSKR